MTLIRPAMRAAIMKMPFYLILAMASSTCHAAPPTRDVVYASPDGHDLKLNLFMPENVDNPPLVVFVHGGGWRAGSYKNVRSPWLDDEGFAFASISYRLTDKATFPAQIHDCKAAIRWLRAHADEYGYNAEKIGVLGTSAGGHLVLLLGTSGDMKELEGDVGGNVDQSSRVQAVVDCYGPSDFVARADINPAKTENPKGSVALLLGGPVSQKLDLAKLASPINHITADDPPLMVLHGKLDRTVAISQSDIMVEAYKSAGLDVTYRVLPEAGHGGKEFFEGEHRTAISEFFRKHLSK